MSLLWGRRAAVGELPSIPRPSEAGGLWRVGNRVVPRTSESALRHAAVWASVRLRADLLGSMPVDVYRRVAGQPAEQVDPPGVLVQPQADARIDEWLAMATGALDLRGNAVGTVVNRDRLGYPTQIELAHPDDVTIRQDSGTGRLVYTVGGSELKPDEVWHARAYRLAGLPWGLSPIAYAASQIGVGLSAAEFGLDWFGEGIHPTSVLETDQPTPGDEQAKAIKRRWIESNRGSREPIVLGNGVKFRPIRVAAGESQFLETQRASGADVARIFGLPPEMLGYAAEGGSLTYANRESRAIDFLAFSFGATVRRWERELSQLTPRGQYVKLNTAALLQTDLLTRYRAHAMAIAAHFLTPDEARRIEDLPPLTAEQTAALAALNVKAPDAGQANPTGGA